METESIDGGGLVLGIDVYTAVTFLNYKQVHKTKSFGEMGVYKGSNYVVWI